MKIELYQLDLQLYHFIHHCWYSVGNFDICHWYLLNIVHNRRLQLNQQCFFGQKKLILLCPPSSLCDPPTDTETMLQLTPSLLTIKSLLFFFYSLDLRFLPLFLYSRISFWNEEAKKRRVVYYMMYVDNLMVVYVGSVELDKVHT